MNCTQQLHLQMELDAPQDLAEKSYWAVATHTACVFEHAHVEKVPSILVTVCVPE